MRSRISAEVIGVVAALVLSSHASAQFTQQGQKLTGNDTVGQSTYGFSVALSADGNTAITGGPDDNSQIGAAWVYTRINGVWTQQGQKLTGNDAIGPAIDQGISVAISNDGNTAIVGGPNDNHGVGAAWIYTRSNGVWSQQGSKLVGTGAGGLTPAQGYSVAISGDGNTAMVGGLGDSNGRGAAWVYTLSNGVWSQQGSKLVGNDAVGRAQQGFSVALSTDGNTAVVGADDIIMFGQGAGAAFVYARSDNVWTQQGSKLVGSGAVGASQQGRVALSGDGNTLIVGGRGDNGGIGAAWVYTRTNGVWTQQGSKLVGTGAVGSASQGSGVALTTNGKIAMVGGPGDDTAAGAVWVFTQSNGVWTQQGNKLVGTSAVGSANQGSNQGYGVSLSGNGSTAIVGGAEDNSEVGAAWVFVQPHFNKPGTHDFNGDGMSDIAWRDTTADTTSGLLTIWEMNGTQVLNPATTPVSSVPYPQWTIIGLGDFNGDGYADILWRDNSNTLAIWEMMGTQILNPNATGVGQVAGWSVIGVGDFNGGDFNGDGMSDMLWTDGSGTYAIWEMNGTTILNPSATGVAVVAGWSVLRVGDFNGDGMSDMLWTDGNGSYAIWEMNGTTVLNPSATGVAYVPTNWAVQLPLGQ